MWHGTRDEPLSKDEWRDADIVRTLYGPNEEQVRAKAAEQNHLRVERRYSRRDELDL